MKSVATLFVAFGVATAGSTAFAEPVQMSEAQLDSVAAGALVADGNLIAVQVNDVASHNNVQVAVPVTAAVGAAVGVLSGPQVAAAQAIQRGTTFGRQTQ